MEVRVVGGYGEEKATAAEQKEFLDDLGDLLKRHRLPVDYLSSERATGGPIVVGLPDDVDPDEIPRAFLSLATAIADQVGGETLQSTDVSFVLLLTGFSEPITIRGTSVVYDGLH